MFNACCTEVSQAKLDRCFSVKQMLEKQDWLNKQLPNGENWSSAYSVDHFSTAIVAELGEILDQESAPQYKWWKQKDIELYDEDMTKMEIVDIVHFWLSIAIVRLRGDLRGKTNFCSPADEFMMYEKVYINGANVQGAGIIEYPANLNHRNFMNLVRQLICGQRDMDSYSWVNTLGMLAASMGMGCEELSAFYQAKVVLNQVRWENPDWIKIDEDGVEDNVRTFSVINGHLSNKASTLDDLKTAILLEFYGQS